MRTGATSRSRNGRNRKKRNAPRRGWTFKQELYLSAAAEHTAGGKPYVQKDIAALVGIDPARVSNWKREPAFRMAIADTIRASHAPLIESAHSSLLAIAARTGNVLAYNTVMDRLERHGRIKTVDVAGDSDPLAPGSALGGTHVHIHAIPERQPMSALPPLLTLPAQSVQAVTTTPAK